jgi:hypothetical protein
MTTDAQLQDFCNKVWSLREDHKAGIAKVVFERGKKNARIIIDDGVQRSAWGFIELATGNILKAAGWKAPARYSRGNISNGVEGCGPYGPAYLR